MTAPLTAADRFALELPGFRFRTFVSRGTPTAKVWKRNADYALTYTGATEEEALQRAFRETLAYERQRVRMQACGRCRGVGWYVIDGNKEVCAHEH